MSNELYKKYRPKKLENMIGQDSCVKVLQSKLKANKIPHFLLFTGPAGCGKTTFARIISKKLGCSKYDFTEVNCADFRGIDMVRSIRTNMGKCPLNGNCNIWLIDEAHKLTGDAQDAFLKMLEDTPTHVYFMMATTDPQKLKKTVRSRSTEIVVKSLSDTDLISLLVRVCEKEKAKIPLRIISKITEHSEGSARKALVILDQIIDLEDEKVMLESISSTTVEKQAINLVKLLLNKNARWNQVAAMLKGLAKEEPESIRWGAMMYARAILLSGSPQSPNAYLIIQAFQDNFYDSKHAGLAAACYEIVMGDKIQ
ncbi:MAG TPA: AAA family ATPase [Desulfatiglandales bacterium]|nr:AAA family ATPase [Desulfatiglandales bacterium]